MFNFFKSKRDQKGKDLEVFFITFDEPLKDLSWKKLKKALPKAQRTDSVKGFDRAHKVCAEKTRGRRFISIDGDNELLPNFHEFTISRELMDSNYVLSWAAANSINGLCYGNGGVKCWPTSLVHEMNCHENATDEKSAVDFCYKLQYFLMPEVLTVSNIHHTPYQAFRSGFREGIKMSLVKGEKLKYSNESQLLQLFTTKIPKSNLERLTIWCSIGQDVENGLWAIYGARRALVEVYINHMPLENIRDYDWFNNYWDTIVYPEFSGGNEKCSVRQTSWDKTKLDYSAEKLRLELNKVLGLELISYDSNQSKEFKRNYKNNRKKGLLK